MFEKRSLRSSKQLHRQKEDGVVEGESGGGPAGDGDADAHHVTQV